MSSELTFMFEREGVDKDFAGKLAEVGIDTVPKFAALVESQSELREMLKEDFGLDWKAGGLAVKAKVSAVLVAWGTAKKRADKAAEVDGERDARQEPKLIPRSDHMAMKKSFETSFWKLEEELSPAKTYLEKKLEQIEKEDLRAEKLDEVLSVRDDADESLRPVWGTDMTLKAIKVSAKIPLPANPEQLRRRLAVMGACWAFVASCHTSRAYLGEASMHVWTEYANYLLGKFVLGILGGEDGEAVGKLEWSIILEYEHEIRRLMVTKMLEGTALASALREAWNDSVTRDRYLVLPLQKRSISSKRPAGSSSSTPVASKKQKVKAEEAVVPYMNNKRAKKGKGKGAANPVAGCAERTSSGEPICFRFNDKTQGCARPKCFFAHVCGVCFRKGVPMHQCKHQ